MNQGSVRVFGGPLDGNSYDLPGDVGSTVELNSAAGVCVYQFASSGNGERILNYVGPAGMSPEEALQGPEF